MRPLGLFARMEQRRGQAGPPPDRAVVVSWVLGVCVGIIALSVMLFPVAPATGPSMPGEISAPGAASDGGEPGRV